jgi:putative ABC transport system permease protein
MKILSFQSFYKSIYYKFATLIESIHLDYYIFHINNYDLAFVALIVVGTTFVMLLWFTKKTNQVANRFAGLALAVVVLWIARVLGIDIGLTRYLPHWSWLPMQFSLALGPFILLYVLKIINPEYKFSLKTLLHFCPLLLEIGAQVPEIIESIRTGVPVYETPAFGLFNPFFRLLAFISVGLYLYKSFRMIEWFYRGIKFTGVDRPRYELRWLHSLLKVFYLLWLLWLSVSVADYLHHLGGQGVYVYYPLYLLLAGIAIYMAALIFSRPEVNLRLETTPLKPFITAHMRQKGVWLKEMVKTKRYYQDPELNLSTLAENLGLHTHDLSRIINTALKKSFNDFINEYRVAEVIHKMHETANDHITLLGIAYESGFNSKSTFNRIFKQMTGKSPIVYKKERPTYNLRRLPQFSAATSYRQTTDEWSYEKLTRNYMFKNYLKTAYRSLLKNKWFTLTNIFGLAVGLASFLLIVFYVFDEMNYDQFNVNINRIFRVNTDIKFGGNETSNATAPAPLFMAIKNDFPEVEKAVRICSTGSFQVKKGDQNVTEDKVAYADSTLFSVFTLPIIIGSVTDALTQPHSVVITESTAIKYFNTTDALGKILTFNNLELYKVTAVIKDMPQQSHFNYNFFISMSTLPESRQDIWLYSNFNTYILLKPGTDYKKFEVKLPGFLKTHAGPQLMGMMHISFDQFEQSGNFFRFNLTPLKDIHLHSNRVSELGPNGNIQYIYIFSAIALFILFIACVNFMNLSTASSSKRAREVGVRKVLGSPRKYLIIQFLTESTLVTLVATLIAVISAYFLLPFFNQMSGKELTITGPIFIWLIPLLFIIVVVIGLLAGSYPAFFLSAFQPIEVLKGKISAGFKGGRLRGVLVVFQFSVSIFLIISTLVIFQQLRFIQNKDLGYNRDHILTIQNIAQLGNQAKTFKEEVRGIAGVQNLTLTGDLPTSIARNSVPIPLFKDSVLDPKRAIKSQVWNVDEDYIPTMDIKLVDGRNFSKQMLTDSSKMIINEAAAKLLGFSDPINQKVYEPQDNMANSLKPFRVIGIMKDFNYKSLRENVTPLIFILKEDREALSVKINSSNIPALLQKVKNQWVKMSPNQPLIYSFMDDDFDALYRSEQRMGEIFLLFTSIAIIIACLGLFALAAYAADQRTKEIGIRKILGADTSKIAFMLSVDFIKLVFIAIVIATPIAWWAMHKWLQEFAYRQSMSPWLFILAGASAILIAVLTISFQSIKAAMLNPVKSLRN